MNHEFDVIVIGGGHVGTEAAWAAASALGTTGRVALVTMDPARIGTMSCNPAIGGLGKGQIVREIDALGGMMGLVADATGILFKVLNASMGFSAGGRLTWAGTAGRRGQEAVARAELASAARLQRWQ